MGWTRWLSCHFHNRLANKIIPVLGNSHAASSSHILCTSQHSCGGIKSSIQPSLLLCLFTGLTSLSHPPPHPPWFTFPPIPFSFALPFVSSCFCSIQTLALKIWRTRLSPWNQRLGNTSEIIESNLSWSCSFPTKRTGGHKKPKLKSFWKAGTASPWDRQDPCPGLAMSPPHQSDLHWSAVSYPIWSELWKPTGVH